MADLFTDKVSSETTVSDDTKIEDENLVSIANKNFFKPASSVEETNRAEISQLETTLRGSDVDTSSSEEIPQPISTPHPPIESETPPAGNLSRRGPLFPFRAIMRRQPLTGPQKVASILLLLFLIGILIPTIFTIGSAVNGYMTYTSLRNQAYSGVTHLLNVKKIFTGPNSHYTGFLDVNKLHSAQKEFAAARNEFQHVQYTLDHSDFISTVTGLLPQYRLQVIAARAGSQMGIDVANIGQKLISTALVLAPTFRGPLLTDATQPLVTPAMIELLHETIGTILPLLRDIQAQTHLFSLDELPISSQQREQFTQLVQALPQVIDDLTQVDNLLDAAGWMLGVDGQRTFLVQTMDRAELRPTGGFTGQFGELQIKAGRIAPFSLKDISLVEYVDNSPTLGHMVPEQYRSWWPFANWGLRDSNLSADFPTSAQIAINQYQREVGHQVDGVILFTPFLVEHILQVIGPISIPSYNEIITAQNLEERLHFYQQDNAGIYKQIRIQPGDTSTSDRKRFTALLAHLVMDKVRHAPPDEILAVARQALHDLKTKDLQVYVTNPQVEDLLMKYGYAATIDRSTTHDGLYVVQANVSASKASQYVRTSIHDVVTLDAQGGATHVMQLRLIYQQIGPVYGYDTYRDYVRVYVPPTSQFLWGNGFDTGTPLCGGYHWYPCPPTDVYPGDELLCPAGLFQPGAAAPSIEDPDGGHWHALDTIGPPTNLASDEPGRAMFGGWVVVPKNCSMTVTLSWYVPPMGSGPYNLLVQRQAGTFPELDLTILPTPGNCALLKTQGLHFDGLITEDESFGLKVSPPTPVAFTHQCYPQSGV